MSHQIFEKYDFHKKYACTPSISSTEFTELCFLMLHTNTHIHAELIKLIPNYKKDINVTTKNGWTPLSLACANNASVECIECLLMLGADPNITINNYYYSPLMIAAAFHTDKSYDILRLLINYGANQNLVSKEGWNASMFACKHGNIKTVSILVNSQNINNSTLIGNTPLMLASNNENHAIAIIKFLLDSGADINKTNVVRQSIYDTKNQDIINLVRKYDKSIYNTIYNFMYPDKKQKID